MTKTHWIYQHRPVRSRADVDPLNATVGFTYRITNKKDNKSYYGRKNWTVAQGKGRKPREDWQTYTGSSKEVHADIARLGVQHFEFWILNPYDTAVRLKMAEACRILENLLYYPDECYNKSVRINFIKPKPKGKPQP